MRYSGAVWSGRSVNLHRLQWHAMPSTEGALRYRLTPSAPRRFVWRRPWPSGPSVGRRDRPRAPPDPTDASPGPPEHRVHLFSLHFLRTPLFSALRGHGRLASRVRWSHGSTRRTAYHDFGISSRHAGSEVLSYGQMGFRPHRPSRIKHRIPSHGIARLTSRRASRRVASPRVPRVPHRASRVAHGICMHL